MPLDIIGAGFGRTGTLSIKHALETLGFERCYHMSEVFRNPEHVPVWQEAHDGQPIDWEALFDGYRATMDWPACNFWQELAERYPDAKVLLSTRDPQRWWESVNNTIYPSTLQAMRAEKPGVRAWGEWANRLIWETVFEGRFEDRAFAIEVYDRHVERVKSAIDADRLLIYEAAQGWEPLCEFLDLSVPDVEFPRVNTTEQFLDGRGAARRPRR